MWFVMFLLSHHQNQLVTLKTLFAYIIIFSRVTVCVSDFHRPTSTVDICNFRLAHSCRFFTLMIGCSLVVISERFF